MHHLSFGPSIGFLYPTIANSICCHSKLNRFQLSCWIKIADLDIHAMCSFWTDEWVRRHNRGTGDNVLFEQAMQDMPIPPPAPLTGLNPSIARGSATSQTSNPLLMSDPEGLIGSTPSTPPTEAYRYDSPGRGRVSLAEVLLSQFLASLLAPQTWRGIVGLTRSSICHA